MTNCHNCGHAVVDGTCTKCGSGAKSQATSTDTPESVYADLRTVVGDGHWADWRAELAQAAAMKRNPPASPEQATEEG